MALDLHVVVGAVAVADLLMDGERRGVAFGRRRVDQVEVAVAVPPRTSIAFRRTGLFTRTWVGR